MKSRKNGLKWSELIKKNLEVIKKIAGEIEHGPSQTRNNYLNKIGINL